MICHLRVSVRMGYCTGLDDSTQILGWRVFEVNLNLWDPQTGDRLSKGPTSKSSCSDITNTLVGISGETGTVARISMFIE